MKIKGLPEHYKNYCLSYFYYAATGEGKTIQAEVLCSKKQNTTIGWPEMRPEIIPLTIKKKFLDQEYLDYNPEFKAKFYETFGFNMWHAFMTVVQEENFIDLKLEMHYNLS